MSGHDGRRHRSDITVPNVDTDRGDIRKPPVPSTDRVTWTLYRPRVTCEYPFVSLGRRLFGANRTVYTYQE